MPSRTLVGASLDALAPGRHPVERLRRRLSARFDAPDVWLTASGTHALQLALGWVRARTGGRVALPAYTCYDVATAALGAGVEVGFYDLDPVTLTPDLDSLRAVLAAGAGSVVVNNLYGFPVDWEAVRLECQDAGAVLIEDAAQGLGSSWGGRPSGTFGDLSILSFGRGKGWAGGAGGALLARGMDGAPPGELEHPGVGQELRAGAAATAQWMLGRPSLYGLPRSIPGLGLGKTRFRPPTRTRTIPAWAAAAVLRNESASDRAVDVRRARARDWSQALAGADALRACQPLEDGGCGFLRFPVRCPPHLLRALDTEGVRLGVGAGYPRVLPDLLGAESPEGRGSTAWPGARELASRLRTLPTHGYVTAREIGGLMNLLEAAENP